MDLSNRFKSSLILFKMLTSAQLNHTGTNIKEIHGITMLYLCLEFDVKSFWLELRSFAVVSRDKILQFSLDISSGLHFEFIQGKE